MTSLNLGRKFGEIAPESTASPGRCTSRSERIAHAASRIIVRSDPETTERFEPLGGERFLANHPDFVDAAGEFGLARRATTFCERSCRVSTGP
jgi:hypothetical protein